MVFKILSFTINNSTSAKIIRRKGDSDPVAGNDTNIMFTHFTRQMSQYKVPILIIQFHSEHCVGKGFLDYALHLYRFLFCHFYPLNKYNN